MNNRIAIKIINSVNTPRWDAYTSAQQAEAQRKYDRLASSRETELFWDLLMRAIGTEGRAKVIKADAGQRFDMLMRDDPKHWDGDPNILITKENK